MTPTPLPCSECGDPLPADAPRGACPCCLLLRAFESLPANEPGDSRATVHLVLPEGPDGVLPFSEIGDYELLKEIGRGGMGVIYQARQRRLDRIVALKLIRAGALAKADGVARFKLEAAATARLRHPGIVAVHEVGEHEGHHFYSMDFVPGRSLAAALREGTLAPRSAAECVRAVAEAIQFAHEHGVIHRDLKPSNILLDAEGQPRVSDFGLAKLLQSDSELTLTGAVLGSPSYMPPEQARGQHAEVGTRSDVYSLGAIPYECLTGRPPFTAATPLETMKLVVEQDAIAPRAINPTLPRDLETICLKCLQKDPAHRYPTAQALADELGRFLRHEPIQARPSTLLERSSKWACRHPARAALAALAVVAPAVIITVLLVMGTKLRRERNIAVQHELGTRERAYAADVYAASQALAVDDLAMARQLLNEHRPTFVVPALAGSSANSFPTRGPAEAGTTSTVLPSTLTSQPSTDLRGFEWRVLWERTRGQETFAHTNLARPAECLVFAPDGRTLVSGGDDGIHLWDMVERRPLGPFPGPDPGPPSSDRPPTVDDLRPLLDASPALVEHLKVQPGLFDYLDSFGHTNRTRAVTSLAFTPDRQHLLVGSRDLVRSWNFATRAFDFAVPELNATVAMPAMGDLFVVANDQQVAPGDERRSAHPQSALVYSFTRRRLVAELPGYGQRAIVSADGQHVAAASRTNGVLLWRPATGETTHLGHDPRFSGLLAFSPDGRTLLIYSDRDRSLMLRDVASKRIKAYLRGEHLQLGAVAWSSDGRFVAGGGENQNIGLWAVWRSESSGNAHEDPPFLLPQAVLHGHEATVTALAFSPDGRWLASAANDHTIRLWTIADAPPTPTVPVARPDDNAMSEFTLDAETGCALGRSGGELTVWNPRQGYAPHRLPGTERHFAAGFLAQGKGLVTVEMTTNGVPAYLEIRRLPEGGVQTRREVLPAPGELQSSGSRVAHQLVASPDGRWLAVPQTSDDRVQDVHVFAIDSGQFVARLPGWPRALLWNLRASPDSRWLVRLAHHNGTNRITSYDSRNWQVAHEIFFRSAGNDVRGAAIDPASRLLVTGGEGDNSIRVWDLHTGRLVGYCNGNVVGWHPVWSRDSRTLVVRDRGSLRLWSMVVFRELAALPAEWHDTHLPLGFTADGRALVIFTLAGRVTTWSPPTLAEIEAAPQP